MALILQCGTAAAAAIIIIFTPPVGLECRSLGYIIYGGVSIVIMFLGIISTIFARISETRKESTIVKSFTAFIAIAFCWISYFLALINGVGLITLSCFQFAHFLDDCYCNASVLGRGVDSYIVVFYDDSKITMRVSRLAATLLSAAVMSMYMGILSRLTFFQTIFRMTVRILFSLLFLAAFVQIFLWHTPLLHGVDRGHFPSVDN